MNTKLTERLKELKMLRKITKSLGKRMDLASTTQPTRIEYPSALDPSVVAQISLPILSSLHIGADQVEYLATKSLTAGVRIFHDGKILDISLDTIETKLLSSF